MGKSIDELDYKFFYPLRAKYQDRDYAIDLALAHLAQYGDERKPGFGNPYIPDESKKQFLDIILQWASEQRDDTWVGELAQFELKAYRKWYGPQGATPTASEVMEVLEMYYQPMEKLSLPPLSAETIMEAFPSSKHVYGTLSARELWLRYPGGRKSNSGLTGWTDRRDPAIRKRAISEAMRFPFRLDPIVVGTRDQRSKKPCRTIFMDSFSNYYREVANYYFLNEMWKDSNLVAWRGDHYVEAYVHKFLQKHPHVIFFEADYKSMDTWLHDDHLEWLLTQIHDRGYITDELYFNALKLTRLLFEAPLWTPFGEINQSHSLLSGLYPTNPFESPLNLLIQLEWVHSVVARKLGRALRLGIDFIIVIQGDDALIVFNDLGLDAEWLKQSFADYAWKVFRIKAEPEKQRVSRISGFFCKRQFKFAGYVREVKGLGVIPKSVYPATLAAMSIFEPEDGALSSKAQSLIKLFQVWDNVQGHPLWRRLLRKLWEIQPELHIPVSDSDVEQWNSEGNHNWRRILFGEMFSLESSPSAKLWYSWSVELK